MADNISQGIRISINTQDITKVRQDFNKLVESLKKQADKPIDFKVNTIGIQEQLKKTASSVEEVVNAYKSLGNVDIKPLNFDKEGNLTKFKVLLEQNNGLIDAITYKANKYIDSSNNIKPISFEIQGIKEFDNSQNMLKDIARAEEILANAEKQSREEINNAIQSTINKRKEEEQLLAQNQDKAINKGIEQEIKDREKIQDAISKTINQRKTEDNILDDNQSKAINKVLDDNFSSIQSFQKKQQKVLDNIKNDYKNIFDPTEIIEFENALTRLSPKSETLENDFSQLENKIKSFKDSLAQQQYNLSLGEKVQTKTPFDFNADTNTIKKYANEIFGVDAQVTKITPKLDKFGNQLKEVSIKTKDTSGAWSNFSLILSQSDGSIRKVDKGLTDVSAKVVGLGDKLKAGLQSMGLFIGATTLLYNAIGKLKSGIQEISTLNKSNVNIAMITGESVENIEKMNKSWLEMSKNMGVVMSQTIESQESWLRSGVSIDEANKNTETNIKLARIAGQTNQEVAESLIILKNAYALNSEEIEGYASKVALLDNQSATSANKINKAMTYSAESFKANGVAMDEALSMVTNFSEKSAKSGESIGRGFVAMMANFHKMQESVKIGDEEETDAVNKLEAMLSKKGLALRKNKDEWLDLGAVIKSIQMNINKFTDVEKSDLAFRIGGKENMELTLSTLNNMQRIDELNQKLKDDSGAKALSEAYSKHLDSIEAKMANLKNASTEFWMSVINGNTIKSGISFLTSFVQTLNGIANSSNTTKIALVGLTATIIALSIAIKKVGVDSVNTALISLIPNIAKFITSGRILTVVLTGISNAFKLLLSPVGLIGVAIGVASFAIINHIKHQNELKEKTEELTASYKTLNDELKNGGASTSSSGYTSVKKAQDEINERLQKQVELQNKLNSTPSNKQTFRGQTTERNLDRVALQKEIDDNNKAIAEQEKVLANAGVQFQKSGDAVSGYKIQVAELTRVEIENSNNEIANQVNEKAMAMWNNREAVISLMQEYQNLNSVENQSVESKTRMSAITKELQNYIVGLQTQTDQYGYSVITNTDLLGENINMLNTEGLTYDNLSKAISVFGMNNTKIMNGATEVTYQQAKARIQILQQEVVAMQNLLNMQHQMQSENDGVITMSGMDKFLKQKQVELGDLSSQVAGIEAIFSKSRSSGVPSVGGSGYTPSATGSDKGGSSSSVKEIADIELKTDRYYNLKDGIDKVNDALELNKTLQETATGERKVQLMKEEQKLLERKLYSLNEINKEQKREKAELESTLSNRGFSISNDEITNLNARLLQLQNSANSKSGDAKENAIEDLKKLEELTKRYIDLVNNELPDSNKEWYEVSNTLKDINKQMVESVTEVQEKMTEVIKAEVEKRKKAIDDELDHKKKALQEEKDLYNKQNAEDDYKSELAKEQQKLKEIEEAILSKSRDTTHQGKAKLQELMNEYKTQQERIDEMIKNNQRDRINEQFDEEQRRLEEEAQKKKDELDKKYDDKSIADIALQAIINGFYQFEGQIYNTQNAISDFMIDTGESLLANGKLLQEELINKLKEASEIIKNLGSMNISINMSNGKLPSYDVGTAYVKGDQVAQIHDGEMIIPKAFNPLLIGNKLTDILRQQILKALPKIPTPIFEGRGKNNTMEFNQPFIVVQGSVTEDTMPMLESMVDRKITDFKILLDEWSHA